MKWVMSIKQFTFGSSTSSMENKKKKKGVFPELMPAKNPQAVRLDSVTLL